MRHWPLLLILLMACDSAAQSRSHPQTAETVLEIYLELPAEYFHCEAKREMGREERAKLIVKQDLEHDYILATSEGHPMEVKLFKDDDGDLAFVAVIVACGPECTCGKMEFLRRDDSRAWVEASVKMSVAQMTEAYEARVAEARGRELYPRFKLPEQDTTIQVQDWETELPIYDLVWTGSAFEVLTRKGGIPED